MYDITCENGTVFSTVDKINDPYQDSVLKYQMGYAILRLS